MTSVVNQRCKRTTDYTWAKFDLCKCWQPQSDGPSFAEIYLFTTQPYQLHYVLKKIKGFGFQVLGCLSVKLGLRIPKPRIPDSTSKNFPGFTYDENQPMTALTCLSRCQSLRMDLQLARHPLRSGIGIHQSQKIKFLHCDYSRADQLQELLLQSAAILCCDCTPKL